MPPGDETLRALVLNATLKHHPQISNTGELAELVLSNLERCGARGEIIRLCDINLPVGLNYRESPEDDWPEVVAKLRPRTSSSSRRRSGGRPLERDAARHRAARLSGRGVHRERKERPLQQGGRGRHHGQEDGALSTIGSIMMVLTFKGFTLPPECAAYWVGEVGDQPAKDRDKRLMNDATRHMAQNVARNLAFYARLLKQHPLRMETRESPAA